MSENPEGRPPLFKTVGELQLKIDAYFGDCDPHVAKRKFVREKANGDTYIAEEDYITEQKPYTITGLAIALGTNRETLLNYQNRDEFFDTVSRAKLRCEQYAEQHLFTGKTPAGAVFNLKNNYGWKDESTVKNLNEDVKTDLDALDSLNEQKEQVGQAAEQELADSNDPRPEAAEQVVEIDPPVQD